MDVCQVCGLPIAVGEYPCIATVRPHERGATSVIGDECDFIRTNGTPTPFRVTSKSEDRRWLKAHGFAIRDTHIGQNGTDKSKFSSSCSAVTAETLAGAKAMLERHHTHAQHEGEIGITSGEGLVRYMADKKRAERGQYF